MKPHGTLVTSTLLALALVASGCSGNGSDGQDPTGPIEVVTFERLSDGVAAALLDAPRLDVTQTRTKEGRTVGWAWVTSRANGNFVSINRQELIEADSGEPGGAIATVATALVDGSLFTTRVAGRDDNQPWSLVNRDVVMGRLASFTGIGVDLEGSGILPLPQQGPSAGEPTRQATVDGGVLWSWTAPFHGGSAVQAWNVHPNCHLRSFSLRFIGDIGAPGMAGIMFPVPPSDAPDQAGPGFSLPTEAHSNRRGPPEKPPPPHEPAARSRGEPDAPEGARPVRRAGRGNRQAARLPLRLGSTRPHALSAIDR